MSEIGDKFKEVFKYYKKKTVAPNLENVIDFSNITEDDQRIFRQNLNTDYHRGIHNSLGLVSCDQWKSYKFRDHPGLIYIRNPFTRVGQRYWMRQCLDVYPNRPNRTNLDIYKNNRIVNWWKDCNGNKECKEYLMKLRWCTLGYHHDWDSKIYSEENRHPFPEDLDLLCRFIANSIGYDKFEPQAAIVNFYHMDSTLSAHTDHSEVNLEAPLLSISFGQSAIFLIGGTSKDVTPSALLLHSGDIVIMAKEARLCYHAVPKVLRSLDQPWNNAEQDNINKVNAKKFKSEISRIELQMQNISKLCSDENYWMQFEDYIKHSRINVNVRQVLYENQNGL